MQLDHKKLAVVIGIGTYNDLGLARSCGKAGMEVILVIPPNTIVPIHRSRYVKKTVRTNTKDSSAIISVLDGLFKQYSSRNIYLYPATDLVACLLDEHANDFPANIHVPNARGRMKSLMDKATMTEIAKASGLLVPYYLRVDLRETPCPDFTLPCIIKPLLSISGEKADITICRERSEYEQTLSHYISKGTYEILIQSLIEGKDLEEIALSGSTDINGEIAIGGIVHKKRIRGNGSTVFAELIVSEKSRLFDEIKIFINKTGYNGIFDIEFLKNSDGYYFIECNFRNGAYGYALTEAGLNLPAIFAGLPRSEKGLRDIIFMEERSDILNVFERKISWKRWILDIFRTDTFLWWNLLDPAPMLRLPKFRKRNNNACKNC